MNDFPANSETGILSDLRQRRDEMQHRLQSLRALTSNELLDELIQRGESRLAELDAKIREVSSTQDNRTPVPSIAPRATMALEQ
jgi:hypothetical protein